MSGFVVAALKVAFLALMWLFIVLVANIIRTDLFGRTATVTELAAEAAVVEPASKKKRFGRKGGLRGGGRLVVIAGRAVGQSIQLSGVIQLGRSADSTLDIDDDYASARHARLWQQDNGEWVIEDLQSTNGTFVNGVQIQGPTIIDGEDIVRIGRSQLKLEK